MTARRTWKKRESDVAHFFQGQRTPLSGGNSKITRSDVIHDELFIECIHDTNIYEHLDKNKCYSFIIRHPENKIVVEHTKPSIIHVSTRDLTTLDECEEKVGIEHPKSFKFDSLQDLVNYCSEQDHKFPGFLLIDEYLSRLRVMAPNYNNVKSLRGNVINIRT